MVIHIITFALMLLEVPSKSVSDQLCSSIYLYMILCVVYASKWRFNLGIKKSQCMSVGYKTGSFVTEHIWYLTENVMEIVTKLGILGVTFTDNGTRSDHVQNRPVTEM